MLNISLNNTKDLLSAKCSERLTTLLNLVHSCWVVFSEIWSQSNFSLNNCWGTQHFLCFEMLSVVQCVWPVTEPFVQFARAQWVIVSTKFSLVQQNAQCVRLPSNWTLLNNTRFCWTNVQCCSVKMFSTFDQGLLKAHFASNVFHEITGLLIVEEECTWPKWTDYSHPCLQKTVKKSRFKKKHNGLWYISAVRFVLAFKSN